MTIALIRRRKSSKAGDGIKKRRQNTTRPFPAIKAVEVMTAGSGSKMRDCKTESTPSVFPVLRHRGKRRARVRGAGLVPRRRTVYSTS